MAMSQPPHKALRMSELIQRMALEQPADDDLNTSDGCLDRSFSENDTREHRNYSNHQTEMTYPNDNYTKNSFLCESKTCNQTYPNSDNQTSNVNQTPMKTPSKCKQTSAIKFKTRTPRSSAKKFTPTRLRLKTSTSKSTLKKSTPMKTSFHVNEGYKSARKCALFPNTNQPSISKQLPSSLLEIHQKNILKPTEEMLVNSLNKCTITSPETNRKNPLTEERVPGSGALDRDRVANLPHIPRVNTQYQSDKFGTPQSANLSANSILKGCLENEAIMPIRPLNPIKMPDYQTPSMRSGVLQSHNRLAKAPLFPIKLEQFDVRNDTAKDRVKTHDKIEIGDKENHVLSESSMDIMQSFSEVNNLNSNISDDDLKMITASWDMSGIEQNISLSKAAKKTDDNSFKFNASMKSDACVSKHDFYDESDRMNGRNNFNNNANLATKQHSIFKPKTYDNNMAHRQNRHPTEEHNALKNNPFPTSLNINYQSVKPTLTKMEPPKTVVSNEMVHKQLTPFCHSNRIETPNKPPASNQHCNNINETRANDMDKILLTKSDDNHSRNPSFTSKENVEKIVNSNNANVLSKEFKTLTLKGRYYTILGKLGAGGSSEVYKVMDPDTTSMYAVKSVNLAVDHSLAQGYVNEIKLLQRLQGSDKVITLFDHEYLERQKRLYVVLEMGETDLSTLMKSYSARGSRLPLLILMAYWTEMLAAVNYIHDNGVIHSDLKPANFLLVHGRLKLIDFGIASSISADATSVVKDSATGTFNYISPEAIAGDRQPIKITYKSDVWSLGCILYSMIYGRTPFSHVTQLWAKIAALSNPNQKIDYPDMKEIPPTLMNALKWCLTFDVKKRPNVQQLIDLPYVYQENGDHCPRSGRSPKTIPVTILAKIRQALTNDEWKTVVDVLEST